VNEGGANLTAIAVFVGFVSLSLFITWWAARRTRSTDEFYTAGSKITGVQNGLALAGDFMSAATFLGLTGLVFIGGSDAAIFTIGVTVSWAFLLFVFADRMRNLGRYTFADIVAYRLQPDRLRMLAAAGTLTVAIPYLIAQMVGAGSLIETLFSIPYFGAVMIVGTLMTVYVAFGGMLATTWVQVTKAVLLLAGGTVLLLLALSHFGFSLDTLFSRAAELHPRGTGIFRPGGLYDDPISVISLALAFVCGTAGLPHVLMRFFTVPKVSDARTSAGWALVFIAILYTTAPAVGAMARLNLTETIQTGEVGAADGNLVYEERPQWFRNWETTGLLGFEDRNDDGRIQYYNDQDPAMAARAESYGWEGNEMVNVDRDIMVLANPEIAKLPDWVIALVAAGGLAAALSTAAGLLLAISSAISHDLLKGMIMPNISEKRELMASRIAMAGAIGVAGYLGLNPPGFAAQTVALAFGLAASSLFPALMMGIFSKRVNRAGAIAGMVTGLVSTLLYIFWFKGWFFIPGTEMAANTADNWFFGISPEAFGAVGAILNFSVALVVSRATAPPPEHIQHLVEDIRVPRGATGAADH